MNCKAIATIVTLLMLTACDTGSAGSGGNAAGLSSRTSGQAEESPGGEKPDHATAQAALDFVISRLDETEVSRVTDKGGNASVTWTPSNAKLASGNWAWTERNFQVTSDSGGVAITDTTERYALSPRELSYPVTAKEIEINGRKMWAVEMECATKDCMAVTGERTDTSQLVFDNEPTVNKTAIAARRESNLWYFYEKDAATRVAHALDVVLSFEGATKRQF